MDKKKKKTQKKTTTKKAEVKKKTVTNKKSSVQKNTTIEKKKNNQSLKFITILIGFLIILSLSIFITENQPLEKEIDKKPIENVKKQIEETKGMSIDKLKADYQNDDIIAFLDIPGVFSYPIVKTTDNNYYLNHQLDHSRNVKGSPFMDYRVNIEDRKILIYGHSGRDDLPFQLLHNYDEESFYKEHPTFYLYSKDKIYTYEIISSYVERNDYDYVNIENFRGLTWLEHLQKLKNKSNYEINLPIDDNSKILILQTCQVENNRSGGRYKLVIGLLTKIEKNHYE